MGHMADDPIAEAAFQSWLAHVKGSWSSSDWKIYLAGYLAGWMERGRQIREASDGRSTETGS
jgi:hypothetical protein